MVSIDFLHRRRQLRAFIYEKTMARVTISQGLVKIELYMKVIYLMRLGSNESPSSLSKVFEVSWALLSIAKNTTINGSNVDAVFKRSFSPLWPFLCIFIFSIIRRNIGSRNAKVCISYSNRQSILVDLLSSVK